MSLREYVEDQGGAIGLREAVGWLLDNAYTIDERGLAELHDELDGPIVGRSRVVTPDLAEEIEDELADEDPADREDDDADGLEDEDVEDEGED